MRYNPDIHHRRSIRLRGYDYSSNRAYFVTVCTHEREITLEDATIASIVRNTWDDLSERFDTVETDEFIVMPNHIHGIIWLQRNADRAQQAGAPTLRAARARQAGTPTLGKAMRAFKSMSAITANEALGRCARPFWQRNYWERVIRDEAELMRVREYIRNNPLDWDRDPNNPANWLLPAKRWRMLSGEIAVLERGVVKAQQASAPTFGRASSG